MADIYVNQGQSIQRALNSANAGDTIIVGAGTYNERVKIRTNGITLTSSGGAIIDGTGLPDWGVFAGLVDVRSARNVTINGLRVINSPSAGIEINDGAHNCTVTNNFVEYSTRSGIGAHGHVGGGEHAVTNLTITGNKLKDCLSIVSQETLTIASVDGYTCSNNELYTTEPNKYGGECITSKHSSRNGVISQNYIHDICGTGIYVGGPNNTNIEVANNHIENLTGGGAKGYLFNHSANGITIRNEHANSTTNGINIHDNLIDGTFRRGIYIHHSGNWVGSGRVIDGVSITNNVVQGGGPNTLADFQIALDPAYTGDVRNIDVSNNSFTSLRGDVYGPSVVFSNNTGGASGTALDPFPCNPNPPDSTPDDTPTDPTTYTATIVITDPDNRVRTFTITSHAKFTIT